MLGIVGNIQHKLISEHSKKMKLLFAALVLITATFSNGFLLQDSCLSKCGAKYDPSRSCQCNKACSRFGSCCSDYTSLCDSSGSSSSFFLSNKVLTTLPPTDSSGSSSSFFLSNKVLTTLPPTDSSGSSSSFFLSNKVLTTLPPTDSSGSSSSFFLSNKVLTTLPPTDSSGNSSGSSSSFFLSNKVLTTLPPTDSSGSSSSFFLSNKVLTTLPPTDSSGSSSSFFLSNKVLTTLPPTDSSGSSSSFFLSNKVLTTLPPTDSSGSSSSFFLSNKVLTTLPPTDSSGSSSSFFLSNKVLTTLPPTDSSGSSSSFFLSNKVLTTLPPTDSSGSSSCWGKCNSAYDRKRQCQCNSLCGNYGNCCPDYSTQCGYVSSYVGSSTSAWTGSGSCMDFSDVTEELWDNDVNRLSTSDVTINDQASVGRTDFRDKSYKNLFSYVDEAKLNASVYTTYLALLDNYDRNKGHPERVTPQEKAEEDAFLDAIMATKTMETLYGYLKCEGKVQSKSNLRSTLRLIWFDLYKRSSSGYALDSSGFEHVMIGDYKSSNVASGLHYWLSFYEEEKKGDLNYYGHTCKTQTNFVCAAFDWNGRKKQRTSFFLRTSPAFDIALYTLCFIFYPNGFCRPVIDGSKINIKTFSIDGHLSTAYIAG
ncbi:hypothetical protein RRG08_033244 [Elysia crispata]|uniref:Uridylate-specific endoribonuclease n=1 Tax=Elysia crispata TaxID=231223 RepID=A0AAE0YXY5_9GAST|nr:hypothetical protein RRG08_033244 [Elysia crispata]